MSADQHARRLEATPAGDAAAFGAFVREHGDSVWRCLQALGLRRANLDDAAQDVFLVAFRQWPDYEERGAARSWLFAIARRVAAGYRRRERSEDGTIDGIHATIDVEDALARRQARAMLDRFLADLDDDRRLVFFLSDVEGWSAPEVALALEIKLNTVYSRLRRARAMFERFLQRRGGTP
jgi:RNA polymerase sigma-70 factor (ECF subfamily)